MPLIPEGELCPKHEYVHVGGLTYFEAFMYKNVYEKIAARIPRVGIYIYIYI